MNKWGKVGLAVLGLSLLASTKEGRAKAWRPWWVKYVELALLALWVAMAWYVWTLFDR